jgi:hypothetical protein
MSRASKQKRNYSAMTLEEAMQLIGRDALTRWQLNVPPRVPSDFLKEDLRRLEFFDLKSSESAKTLLMDVLFAEIVPLHGKLKVWKEATLNTDTLTGVADHLIAPKRAYLATPLLCVAEAKKDDFARGQAQCLAEMAACQWTNRQRGQDIDVYGVVSNGQVWQFYKLTQGSEIFESGLYTVDDLPELLGVLDYICGECANNIPGRDSDGQHNGSKPS